MQISCSTNNGKTDLIVSRWLDNKFYVANFNATYKKEGLEIISGFSYSNYSNSHFGEVIWAKQFAQQQLLETNIMKVILTKTILVCSLKPLLKSVTA